MDMRFPVIRNRSTSVLSSIAILQSLNKRLALFAPPLYPFGQDTFIFWKFLAFLPVRVIRHSLLPVP